MVPGNALTYLRLAIPSYRKSPAAPSAPAPKDNRTHFFTHRWFYPTKIKPVIMEHLVAGIGVTTLYGIAVIFVAIIAYLVWKKRAGK
jgi:hypothetical protein